MVNLAALVQSLSKIKIVNMHANKAKRPRVAVNSDHGGGVKTRVEFVSKQKDKIINNVQKSQCNSGKSYAGVVAGGLSHDYEKSQSQSESISIGEVFANNAYPNALLRCLKDFRSIANTRNLCQGEGFLEVETVYLGGLWVLLDFNSLAIREAFLKHGAFNAWFSILKPWHNDFVVKERLLWLKIEGVPLLAWCHGTFKKIASKWGEMVFYDDSDCSNRHSMRVGIKTAQGPLVFESILVNLGGVDYCVRVRELCSWTPTFIKGFKDLEGENFVKDNSDYSDEESSNNEEAREVENLNLDGEKRAGRRK